jgi:hypothetical protein
MPVPGIVNVLCGLGTAPPDGVVGVVEAPGAVGVGAAAPGAAVVGTEGTEVVGVAVVGTVA